MTLDPLARARALMEIAKASATTIATTAMPTRVAPTPTALLPLDWRAAFKDALVNGPWRPVQEIGQDGRLHDHSPMPPKEMITSVQATLFKEAERVSTAKRKRDTKPKDMPASHRLLIEIWTVPHAEIVRKRSATQWRRYCQLRTGKGAVGSLTNALRTGQISREFKDYAEGIIFGRGAGSDRDLFGVPYDKELGWFYYDEHLIEIDMSDEEEPVLRLHRLREVVAEIILTDEYADPTCRMQSGGFITHTGRENFAQEAM